MALKFKKIQSIIRPVLDVIISPITLLSALLLVFIRKAGIKKFNVSKFILAKVGVFPIRDHYYEPLINHKHLKKSLREDRMLPGIDFNVHEQLQLLSKFKYNDELKTFPLEKSTNGKSFYYHNEFFVAGDSEYLYNIIRHLKPKNIIEVGSGFSTLMACEAIKKNKKDDESYICKHICIEPYENDWLEDQDVKVLRKKVEHIDKSIFSSLSEADILFIDSSHIIKPQGDVLFEYLEILPTLNKGVLVHIHDIFTPKDYLDDWVLNKMLFWNEQYLLEAFLTFNNKYKIIGALNYLKHNYFKELSEKCPILKNEPQCEPGSFWLKSV